MSVKSDSNKLLVFGVRVVAFSFFPLLWFLSQAILFREITNKIPRPLLIFLAIVVGSTFIFLLYAGMNRIISYAPKNYQEGLYGAMFVGPAIFLRYPRRPRERHSQHAASGAPRIHVARRQHKLLSLARRNQ